MVADLVVNINETVNLSESVNVTVGLYFELTESVSVSGLKNNSSTIELDFESNSNMLKGFRITVPNFQNKSVIKKAYQLAYRFTNLISLRTGMYIFHKRAKQIINNVITDNIVSFGMDTILTKLVNLDMENSEMKCLLEMDSKENQQLAHFSNGLRSLKDGNYADSIKEFYQVIENEIPLHLKKYKYLRHGVSHAELINSTTIDTLKNEFNIDCIENPNSVLTPKGKYVDITNPDVQDIIEKESNNLREEIICILDSKIGVITN